jgi:uncharacterized membrane protein
VLTVTLATAAACQLALVFLSIGSDLDLFRVTAFGLAATLLVFAAVIFDAERHTYAGLRMPWPVPSDRGWIFIHRATGLIGALGAVALAWLAWTDPGPAVLVSAVVASLLAVPLVAGLSTIAFGRL